MRCLEVSRNTVNRMIRCHLIQLYKVGGHAPASLIWRADLDALVQARRKAGIQKTDGPTDVAAGHH